MSLLGNLFGKVEQTVAELSSDGSVVRVVHEPKEPSFVQKLLGMLEFEKGSYPDRVREEIGTSVQASSCNDPSSPDYQYQYDYDADNNGYCSGHEG